jgi:nitrite reductase/ring-hydroxylating ferredoxin subunit
VPLTKVCLLDLIRTEALRQFTIKDLEILVAKVENKFYGLEARCSHAGAPLEEGTLDGEVLTCPWHGSQFRVSDGSVLRGPAEKNLKTYRLILQGETLFIEL